MDIVQDLISHKKGMNLELLGNDYVFDEFTPCCIQDVFHKEMIDVLRSYYRQGVEQNRFVLGDRQSQRYKKRNEPLSLLVHTHLQPLIERITGFAVKPTYTYFSSYTHGSDLPPHTDNTECEITVSLLIDNDSPWPIYYDNTKQDKPNKGRYKHKPLPHKCTSLTCPSNSIIIFNGMDHIHYRNEYPGEYYDVMLFHYIKL